MSPLIADRFEVLSELSDQTIRARDTRSGSEVVLAHVALGEETDWPNAEAFADSAGWLLELDHPAIPRFVHAFCDDGTGYLVRESLDGPTLAQLAEDGKRWSESEMVRDATAVLSALSYLHGLDPPVAHGALCPENLQRRPDGDVALLGVRPQRADPQECEHDLLALGWMFTRLLAGTDAAEVDDLDIAPALSVLLRRLTRPDAVNRYGSADQVLADLDALEARTAPLKPPGDDTKPTKPKPVPPENLASTAPLAAPKPVEDLASTAPLAAPKPVEKNLAATAPLAAPKPVGVSPAKVLKIAEPEDEQEALYFRRTKNFPKWSTVEPTAHGEFLIEFEMRDLEERRLEISIVDKLERLELRTFVNRGKREAARKRRVLMVLAIGGVASMGTAFGYPPLLPLAIVATIAGVAFLMLKNDEADERPALELTITPDELTIVRNEEFRLRASPRSARWYLERNTELLMATDREVPVLELSREARIPADWFWTYLRARCQEIGSRGKKSKSSSEDATITREAAVRPGLAQK